MQIDDMQAQAGKAVSLLKALANENRLLILCHLQAGELSVGEINERVGLSQSALSQHLAMTCTKTPVKSKPPSPRPKAATSRTWRPIQPRR